MVRFRFFVLDVLGRIDRGFERDCRNEAEAMAVARQLAGGDTVEVWRDRRLLARLPGT